VISVKKPRELKASVLVAEQSSFVLIVGTESQTRITIVRFVDVRCDTM
jgi:hypothetical protein